MPTYKQVFLKPGRYHIGGGRMRDLTAEDIDQFAAGTLSCLKAGLHVPLLSEHAEPGSDAGAPVQMTDALKTAGWVQGLEKNKAGEWEVVFDVTAPEYAKKIDEGSIKFTSPELREAYTDGKGRKHGRTFTHFALTPRPRNPDQSVLKNDGVAQFSLAQFADDEEKKPGEEKPGGNRTQEDQPTTEVTNPDLENKSGEESRRLKEEAVVKLFEEIGVGLPADLDLSSMSDEALSTLLAALKTRAMSEKKSSEEEQTNTDSETEEQVPMTVQMSEANEKLRKRLDERDREHLETLITRARLPRGIKDKLVERAKAVQFSDEGTESPSLSLAEVVKLIEEGIPEIFQMSQQELTVRDHPAGASFYSRSEAGSPEDAKAHVDDLAKRHSGLFTAAP